MQVVTDAEHAAKLLNTSDIGATPESLGLERKVVLERMKEVMKKPSVAVARRMRRQAAGTDADDPCHQSCNKLIKDSTRGTLPAEYRIDVWRDKIVLGSVYIKIVSGDVS